jgi:hypothetical protein
MVEYSKRGSVALHLLLVLLFVPVNNSFSQDPEQITVSLKSNNKPLHQVLDDLTTQCGYYFTFDSRLIDSRQPVTINLTDVPLSTAIDTLFRIPGLSFQTINKNIVIFPERSGYPPLKAIPPAKQTTC